MFGRSRSAPGRAGAGRQAGAGLLRRGRDRRGQRQGSPAPARPRWPTARPGVRRSARPSQPKSVHPAIAIIVGKSAAYAMRNAFASGQDAEAEEGVGEVVGQDQQQHPADQRRRDHRDARAGAGSRRRDSRLATACTARSGRTSGRGDRSRTSSCSPRRQPRRGGRLGDEEQPLGEQVHDGRSRRERQRGDHPAPARRGASRGDRLSHASGTGAVRTRQSGPSRGRRSGWQTPVRRPPACSRSSSRGIRDSIATTCESVLGTNSTTSARPARWKNSATMSNGTWLASDRWCMSPSASTRSAGPRSSSDSRSS